MTDTGQARIRALEREVSALKEENESLAKDVERLCLQAGSSMFE